jgi:dihydroorotase
MTLYLTEQTDPADVRAGHKSGLIKALKLYPAGATTNSDAGVRDIEAVYSVLETMAQIGLPLLVHGEVVDSEIDIFDREAVFIDRVLAPLQRRLPELKIVFEHITTADGAAFVEAAPANVAATVTPHHLMINRNAMLVGGIQPHNYCLPVPKRETHREALVKAVTSGNESFFLGTDSAPHLDDDKETACGCAGIFNVSVAIACYAQVFDDAGALEHLEAFTSLNGPAFYDLPASDQKTILSKSENPPTLPTPIAVGGRYLTHFDPGYPVYWQVL